MRPFIILILCGIAFPGLAIADSFLVSKGAEIYVVRTPNDAIELRHSREIEARPVMYLPAGTLAMELDNNNVRSRNTNYEILLTESGIWGFYKPDGFSFYNHDWLNATKEWAKDMAGNEYSRCPKFDQEKQLQLIFPTIATDVEQMIGGQIIVGTAEPGQFYYNLRDERLGNRVVGYLPLPFEDNCIEVTLPRSDVRLLSVTYKGFLSTSCEMEFGNGCIYTSLNDIRAEYFLNTRILSDKEERYSCAVEATVSYSENRARDLVTSFESSIGSNAGLVRVNVEARVQATLSERIINQETRRFGPEFEVLRNFYIIADGTDVEILETWTKCPEKDGQIEPLTGEEQPVYHYYALANTRQTFGPEFADKFEIEHIDSKGHLIISSPRQLKIIRDTLSGERQLEQGQVDFIMSQVFLWQD